MILEERIDSFAQLGVIIKGLSSSELQVLCIRAKLENPWFTEENVLHALEGITQFLDKETLQQWTRPYSLDKVISKRIGVAMAGNIPMVGFHDLLCVLISGHIVVAKFSSQDTVLMDFICQQLKRINPAFDQKIFIEDRLTGIDKVIATGSDNTGRYFEYYFRNIPHLLRKNRSSCAVIMGEESEAQLVELGKDVFSYFGLGCRNVSKLYLPEGFDMIKLMKAWEAYLDIANHHKYANNYTYQRSILLMNQIHFYDNGAVILSESKLLVSPISVVYYEYYKNLEDLKNILDQHQEKLQCIVSANGWYQQSVAFGKSQLPEVWEYADKVDALKFLIASS